MINRKIILCHNNKTIIQNWNIKKMDLRNGWIYFNAIHITHGFYVLWNILLQTLESCPKWWTMKLSVSLLSIIVYQKPNYAFAVIRYFKKSRHRWISVECIFLKIVKKFQVYWIAVGSLLIEVFKMWTKTYNQTK